MTLDEKTRLDLRQRFVELLGERLADAAMEAMPPIDYSQLATKSDLAALELSLRGEINLGLAKMLRTVVLTHIGSVIAVAGITAGLA